MTDHGVVHAIHPPERIFFTFEYEGEPGHVLLETVTFANQNGMTFMTDKSVFQSVADCDGMYNLDNLFSTDRALQNKAFFDVLAATEQPVPWAYAT